LANRVVIRLLNGRLAWYPPGASEEPRWLTEPAEIEALASFQGRQRASLCFAAPAEDVRLLQIPVSAEEKKHIARSLPFLLEEEVAQDIEQLHFSSGAVRDGELPVAICSREHMQGWQDLLAGLPVVSQWVPEPLLLPWQPGEWTVLLESGRALVRLGEHRGFGIERDSLAALLAAALLEDRPESIIVYGADQASDLEDLPEELQTGMQWRRGNLYTAMMLSDTASTPVNLLQGGYAPRLPLVRWWQQWRAVAAMLAGAFVLQSVVTFLDYRALKKDNLELRAAVEASYRQANPRGNVTDAEKQLQRQLQGLRGTGQGAGFVSLVSRVGSVIASQPGTRVASINYSDRGGKMRMNILASDYGTVEKLREDINSAGLKAVMESSSAQGNEVRARLSIGDGT